MREPNATLTDPQALQYIFLVVQHIKKGRSYYGAVKLIQKEKGLKSVQTVYTACTNQIHLTPQQFLNMLENIPSLVAYLISLFPDHEQEIRVKIAT